MIKSGVGLWRVHLHLASFSLEILRIPRDFLFLFLFFNGD